MTEISGNFIYWLGFSIDIVYIIIFGFLLVASCITICLGGFSHDSDSEFLPESIIGALTYLGSIVFLIVGFFIYEQNGYFLYSFIGKGILSFIFIILSIVFPISHKRDRSNYVKKGIHLSFLVTIIIKLIHYYAY